MAKLTLNTLDTLRQNSGLTALNENSDLIEAAVENTLSRNGTSPNEMGANLDMNSYRILNLPYPNANTEPVRLIDLTDTLAELNPAMAQHATLTEVQEGTLTTRYISPLRLKQGIAYHAFLKVATKAALTALLSANLTNGDLYYIHGYASANDGGQGFFYWDSASSATADGGTILQLDAGGVGRFKRVFMGAVDPRWFGCKFTGGSANATANLTAWNNVISGLNARNFDWVQLPPGEMYIDGNPSQITADKFRINGLGTHATKIIMASTAGTAGRFIDLSTTADYCRIHDLTLECDNDATVNSDSAIRIQGCTEPHIYNIKFVDVGSACQFSTASSLAPVRRGTFSRWTGTCVMGAGGFVYDIIYILNCMFFDLSVNGNLTARGENTAFRGMHIRPQNNNGCDGNTFIGIDCNQENTAVVAYHNLDVTTANGSFGNAVFINCIWDQQTTRAFTLAMNGVSAGNFSARFEGCRFTNRGATNTASMIYLDKGSTTCNLIMTFQNCQIASGDGSCVELTGTNTDENINIIFANCIFNDRGNGASRPVVLCGVKNLQMMNNKVIANLTLSFTVTYNYLVRFTAHVASFHIVGNDVHECVRGAVDVDSLSTGYSTAQVIEDNASRAGYWPLRKVTTTDATATTLVTMTITDDYVHFIEAQVMAIVSGNGSGDAVGYTLRAVVKSSAGTATMVGSAVSSEINDAGSAACDCVIDVNGDNARIRVTGEAATTYNWALVAIRMHRLQA